MAEAAAETKGVSFYLMRLVDNFTIQTSEVAVQHLPHLVQLCQRQVVGEQLYRECVKGFIFFCNVEALRLELGERNKRLALTSVREQLSV